jgi:hypothetical protein
MIKINYRWIKIDLKKLLINLGETQKICPTLTKKKRGVYFCLNGGKMNN